MSIKLVMPSNHLILGRPLFLLSSIFPSTRVFSNESTLLIKWPKYWSFSFNISPSNEHSGPFSCRMDWMDLLAVQGTLKSLLQQHSSEASILQCTAFFIVQLSHLYLTTGKATALTRRTFFGITVSGGLQRDSAIHIHVSILSQWRRKWHPTPVSLPGEFCGQRSLMGYSPWGHKKLDTTQRLTDSLPKSPPIQAAV